MTVSQRMMIRPSDIINTYLRNRAHVEIWFCDSAHFHIEGYIIGFDEEEMDIVLDEAEEVYSDTMDRIKWGRIFVQGNNISLIRSSSPQ